MEAFGKAELAKLAPSELESDEHILKVRRDLKNVIDTARDEGLQQGIEQGIEQGKEVGRTQKAIEIAATLKKSGVALEIITKATGLSEEEIKSL